MVNRTLSPNIGAYVENLCITLVAKVLYWSDTLQGGGKSGSGNKKAGNKAGIGGAGLALDRDWIGEHASQVARMLPGGLHVVGIYVLSPEDKCISVTNASKECPIQYTCP